MSSSREFLMFFENVIIPHFTIEEEKVFLTVLNIKPEAEQLIAQLKEEHKVHFSLFARIKEAIKELCIISVRHTEKEEPLYQTVLEEVFKKVGRK